MNETKQERGKQLFMEALDMGSKGNAKAKSVIRRYGLTEQQRREYCNEWLNKTNLKEWNAKHELGK